MTTLKPLPPGAVANHDVTPDVTAWALDLLHDQARYPLGAVTLPRRFGDRMLVARLEVHQNGTAENPAPHPHRGVSTYVLPVVLAADEPPPPIRAGTSRVLGVDVSHYQAGADWAAIAGAGYAFASIKVSEGLTGTTAVDISGAAHYGHAGDVGLLRGAYHFFRPATSDAVAQVRHFLDVADKIGPWELPPTLDVEWLRQEDPSTPVLESLGGLSPQVFADRLVAAVHELAALSRRRPILYIAPGFWSLLRGHADAVVDVVDLWLAHYTRGGAEPPPLAPFPAWRFWQFSASAHVPGIEGNADVDQFAGTLEELRAYAGADDAPTTEPSGDLDAGGRLWKLAADIDAGAEGIPPTDVRS
jgi:GH25 family lysozyme M1 (1,4-beta-N-acetylmuramidase)